VSTDRSTARNFERQRGDLTLYALGY